MSNEIKHKCNFCGKEFDVWDEQNDFSITKSGIQYGSKYDLDGFEIHLCNDCFDLMVDTFRPKCVIDPVKSH